MSLWKTIKTKFGFDISTKKDSTHIHLKNMPIGLEPEIKKAIKDKEFGDKEIIRTYHTADRFFLKSSNKGGMGIVYIAEKEKDSKLYALKVIREDRLEGKTEREAFIKRFRWESQVWTILGKHRNIVQAHYFDLISNYKPLLIMEYVEGHPEYGNTLDRWTNRTVLDIPAILNFSIQTLTGLLYAQKVIKNELQMVFVHRDLKPTNIMITKDKIVKVTDFGLVKAFESIDGNLELKVEDGSVERISILKTGGICGTPPYMAPEQWLGEKVDERTDIYAMGCVIYEMIRSRPPFLCPPEQKELYKEFYRQKHLNETPEPPMRRGDRIPQELIRLIFKCLEKKKEKRFQTIYDLREELQEVHYRLTGKKVEVKDEPEEATAVDLSNKGNGFHSLGFLNKALTCYREALRLNPEFAEVHVSLGYTLYKKNLLDEAIKEYEEALRINPEYVKAHNNLGGALYKKNLLDEAIREYEKALRINSEYAEAHYNLGLALYKKGFLDETIKEYKEALRINPEFAEAHNNLGILFEDKGLLDDALVEFREAIRINPNFAEPYYRQALVLKKLGEVEEPLNLCRKYLELAKDTQSQKDWIIKAQEHVRDLEKKLKIA